MGPQVQFLADLTVALVAAGAGAFIASRLRLSPILGYLAAGIAIGPFTPGYVASGGTIESLAELGLIFLLFSLGLGFSIGELRAIRTAAIAGNIVVMAIIGAAFAGLAVAAHLPHPVLLGIIVSLSSTAVGAAFLGQWGLADRRFGQLVLALLVVQDLVAAALLVIASTPADALTPVGILVPVLRAAAFVAVALLLGATVLHQLVLRIVQRAPVDALFGAFAALALVAAWLAYLVGLSFEFGAFIAGAVVSEAAGSRMVQSIVAPFRALFASLFFVSMGMAFDPLLAREHLGIALAIGVAFLVVRFVTWGALMRILGLAPAAALLAGIALLPLGEFNIVLANASTAAHTTSAPEHAVLLTVTFLSILVAAVGGSLARLLPQLRRERIPFEGLPPDEASALIIGYGRVGRTVAAALRSAAIPFVVIEREARLVEEARRDGVRIVRGDGADPLVLESLSGTTTRIIVAVTPDSTTNAAIAQRMSSAVPVIVRATDHFDVTLLEERGASAALVPETEGARVFARLTLERLGVPASQISGHVDSRPTTSR
jgi:monovalent cation:H+ antiporter-2, CPA2 family